MKLLHGYNAKQVASDSKIRAHIKIATWFQKQTKELDKGEVQIYYT